MSETPASESGMPRASARSGAGGAEPDAAQESQDTPAALLLAGRKLFAQHGYEGASVRAITSQAGANLGAITYHFGSKRALYNRVVEACVSPLAERVQAALSAPQPVLGRLELVLRAYFDHFAENPELPRLMMQELVLGGGPPEAAGPTMRRIYGLILAAIREGQAVGEVREGDPVLLVLSLIAQPIFPMLVRQPVKTIAGLDMRDAATRERVVAHLASFTRAALARPPEEGR